MQRNLYWPLCVLNVVKYNEGVSRCIDQKPSLASNFEKTVAPDNLWEISSYVGTLSCSLMIALLRSHESKHMHSDPLGLQG